MVDRVEQGLQQLRPRHTASRYLLMKTIAWMRTGEETDLAGECMHDEVIRLCETLTNHPTMQIHQPLDDASLDRYFIDMKEHVLRDTTS